MTPTYQPPVSGWSERKRLIRFRRQREHLRFSEEIKLVPRGLVIGVLALLALAEIVTLTLCAHDIPEQWPLVVDYGMKVGLNLVAAIVFGIWLAIAPVILLTGYVYRDARRRGMNAALWVFIVLIMLPAYVAAGYILYFVAREPLPYHCPRCGSMVSARFNYCPGCKYALHRTCGFCQREVGDVDRYCPHCGNDMAGAIQQV